MKRFTILGLALILAASCSRGKSATPISLSFVPAADFEMGSAVVSPPICLSGEDGSKLIVALSSEGRAGCFDPASGKELWRRDTGMGFEASPAVVRQINGGTGIVAASLEGGAFLFDARSGEVLAQTDDLGQVKGGFASALFPETSREGTEAVLYTGDYTNTLWKLDQATLKPLGRFEAGNFINGKPCVTGSGLVVFGSCDGNLYGLDGRSLEKVFTVRAGSYVASGPVAADDRIYFVTYEGDAFEVDGNGKHVWEGISGQPEPVTRTPLLTRNLLVYGTQKGNVYALDRETGRRRWKFEAGSSVDFEPVETEGGIVVCAASGRLSLLDPETGKETASFSMGSAPSVAGAWDGTYFAVGTATGRLLVFTIGGIP